MKKAILLSTVFSLAAAGVSAQAVNVKELGQRKMVKNTPVLELSTKHVLSFDKMQSTNRVNNNFSVSPRSIDNGLYYDKPAGSMYTTDNEEGGGYYCNHLILSPSADAVFTNMTTSNKKSTKWYLGSNSVQDYADSDYNLDLTGFFSCYNGSAYAVPTLKYGSSRTYQIGETGDYFASNGPGYMYCDSIAPHAFFDSRVDGTYALTGLLDSYYCFGTGNYSGTGAYPSVGAIQLYDAPASPLYVENIYFNGYTMADAPLTDDAQMTMTIYKTTVTSDGNISFGDEIATLTCPASNAIKTWDGTQTSYGYVTGWNYNFTTEDNKPFTIDGSFAVQISGFADEGVDVLMPGAFLSDVDSVANYSSAYAVFNVNGSEYPLQAYSDPVVLPLAFNSCFDYVDGLATVQLSNGTTVEKANVVRISDDGQTCSTDGADDASDLGGAYIRTVFPFYDENGDAVYTTSLPDWITDMTADDSYATSGGYEYFAGSAHLTFEAKPLGTETGRGAAIYFKGKGVTSTTPIYVLQGDATTTTGIEKVVIDLDNNGLDANAPIYNLNGQRVTKDAKGVLIQGGKKFINK